EKDKTSSCRAQHLSAGLTALISYISRGVKRRNLSGNGILDKPNSWVDRTPFSARQLPLELFRERIPFEN
ncbi:hypothetical protein IGI04_036102, partial [Brassica rapa subsp. trilocularis]